MKNLMKVLMIDWARYCVFRNGKYANNKAIMILNALTARFNGFAYVFWMRLGSSDITLFR